MKIINPANGQLLREYDEHTDAQVEQKLQEADKAFAHLRRMPFQERAKRMLAAADVIERERESYARQMTEEMGKPIKQAAAEIDKCAWVCRYYAENAERFLSPEPAETGDARSYVRFDPLGTVLAIMPWNFPFWQVFRFAAPALMAGNTGLLKHASNVAGSALAIEDVFREAGFPEAAFTALLIPSAKVAEVIGHPVVAAVTLTGSERAGAAVAQQAGKQLKKTVLELGGSDPFIVLGDVDLAHAVGQAVKSRTINSGQSCIAAKRFIVEASVVEKFTEAMVEQVKSLKVGDPMDRETDIGPLARGDLRDSLHDQVQRSVESGAKLLVGGEQLGGEGSFYSPTVLGDVRPGMAAFEEETFGPVAAIISAKDADQAVQLANQSRYGLGASIWTGDVERGERLAAEVESGCVFINEFVKSDPRVPFGGVKRSGYGRELAHFGIREFTNIKTVWVEGST